MAKESYKLEYTGNRRLAQNSVYLCSECNSKVNMNTERANLMRSVTCWGCSKPIRVAAEGEDTPDFASGIIIILDRLNVNGIISRLTRASDVKSKLDGAVKVSKAITENHDAVRVNVYTNEYEIDNKQDAENFISENNSSLDSAIKLIQSLPNFNVEYTFKEMNDGNTDIFVYFYHRNIPSPT